MTDFTSHRKIIHPSSVFSRFHVAALKTFVTDFTKDSQTPPIKGLIQKRV